MPPGVEGTIGDLEISSQGTALALWVGAKLLKTPRGSLGRAAVTALISSVPMPRGPVSGGQGLAVIGVLCIATGLILDLVAHVRRETKRLAYLALPAPRARLNATRCKPPPRCVAGPGSAPP